MPFHRFENREFNVLTPGGVAQTLRGTPTLEATIMGLSAAERERSRLYSSAQQGIILSF